MPCAKLYPNTKGRAQVLARSLQVLITYLKWHQILNNTLKTIVAR